MTSWDTGHGLTVVYDAAGCAMAVNLEALRCLSVAPRMEALSETSVTGRRSSEIRVWRVGRDRIPWVGCGSQVSPPHRGMPAALDKSVFRLPRVDLGRIGELSAAIFSRGRGGLFRHVCESRFIRPAAVGPNPAEDFSLGMLKGDSA